MGRLPLDKSVLKPPVTAARLNSVVERLVSNLNVDKIVLFGSYATGKPTKDSDVDLLVILRTKEKGLKRYMTVSRLLEPRSVPLDLIIKTPAEIQKRAKFFDPFVKGILRTGKILYEKKA